MGGEYVDSLTIERMCAINTEPRIWPLRTCRWRQIHSSWRYARRSVRQAICEQSSKSSGRTWRRLKSHGRNFKVCCERLSDVWTKLEQIIELQREELASAHVERERMAQTLRPLHSRLRQSASVVPYQGKVTIPGAEVVGPASRDPREKRAVWPLSREGEFAPPAEPLEVDPVPTTEESRADPSFAADGRSCSRDSNSRHSGWRHLMAPVSSS